MIDERETLERELERFTPEPGLVERVVRRRERKHRRQRLTAGALGIAIVVAMIVAAVTASRAPVPTPGDDTEGTRERPTFTQQVFTLDEEPGVYIVDVGTGEAKRLPGSITDLVHENWWDAHYQASPDGTRLLFTGVDDAGRPQAFLASLDGHSIRQLTDEPRGAEEASFSPDGAKIVYIALGGTHDDDPADLALMEIATGERVILVHAGRSEYPYDSPPHGRQSFSNPRFSPDGRTILYSNGLWGHLMSIPVEGRHPTLLAREAGWSAVYSPDGTTIAYVRNVMVCYETCHHMGDTGQLWLADADGGNRHSFAGPGTGSPQWSPDGTRIAFARAVDPDAHVGGVEVGSAGPGSDNLAGRVLVLDVASGAITGIAGAEMPLTWLDDRTLILGV